MYPIPVFTFVFSYHFTYVVRYHLETVFRFLWFGRGVAWPLETYDLAPFDLFHCGHLRSLICDTPMKTEENLVVSILAACEFIHNRPGMFEKCVPQYGTSLHFLL
jgi:hypothetical protein